jgi:quinohemoprotein ethanol dehydrogenase
LLPMMQVQVKSSGVIASPLNYMVDGRQYVSIAVGWGGVIGLWTKYTKENYPGTIFTFALDAKEKYPGFYETKSKELIKIDFSATKEEISHGEMLFEKYCSVCHGWMGANGGSIPNLAYSSEGTFAIFEDIVLRKTFLKKGMPDFSDRLNQQETSDIRSYILHSANGLRSKATE